MEIWKDVTGFNGRYKVSSKGRVLSINYHGTGISRILRQDTTADGYKRVVLSLDSKTTRFSVHRLVAIAFIPNPLGLPCVNHKDQNPSNNNVENLEWCTVRYNMTYKDARQRWQKTINELKGAWMELPVWMLSLSGERIRRFKSLHEAAAYHNLNVSNLCACLKGRRKTFAGFKWRYDNGEE